MVLYEQFVMPFGWPIHVVYINLMKQALESFIGSLRVIYSVYFLIYKNSRKDQNVYQGGFLQCRTRKNLILV